MRQLERLATNDSSGSTPSALPRYAGEVEARTVTPASKVQSWFRSFRTPAPSISGQKSPGPSPEGTISFISVYKGTEGGFDGCDLPGVWARFPPKNSSKP